MKLDGSITLAELRQREASLPKSQAIVFYCEGANEATSAGQAEHYRSRGFTNARALRGGVQAWTDAKAA